MRQIFFQPNGEAFPIGVLPLYFGGSAFEQAQTLSEASKNTASTKIQNGCFFRSVELHHNDVRGCRSCCHIGANKGKCDNVRKRGCRHDPFCHCFGSVQGVSV